MNILPKKRWHVRTKENIARVRKDEAEAALKEREERLRIENADREARLNLLKLKSKQNLSQSCQAPKPHQEETPTNEHINLFSDLEHSVNSSNKDHDREVKEKKEEYEKKIGYLTYLGQDTNEALKKKNWYDVHPEASRFTRSDIIKETYDKLVLKDSDGKPKDREDIKNGEVEWKTKQRQDPLNAFKKFSQNQITSNKEVKSSTFCYQIKLKDKKLQHKEDKYKKLQKLRIARLEREKQEKLKTETFLKGLHSPVEKVEKIPTNKIQRKYNSQFNPELARQNYR